jgi:ABC-type multidrug transport system fused ATPase/permease subunit
VHYSDVDLIEKGIGDKLALLFQYFSAFVAGFVIGFVYGWKLTLVILAVSPLLAIAGGIMGKVSLV